MGLSHVTLLLEHRFMQWVAFSTNRTGSTRFPLRTGQRWGARVMAGSAHRSAGADASTRDRSARRMITSFLGGAEMPVKNVEEAFL